jgi:hypothetical protein
MRNSTAKPQLKWSWKPKQKWLTVLVSIVAMVASTLVVQCKTDGTITLKTQPIPPVGAESESA